MCLALAEEPQQPEDKRTHVNETTLNNVPPHVSGFTCMFAGRVPQEVGSESPDVLRYQAEEGPAFMNPLRGDEMTELRFQHVALLFSFVV